MNSNVRLLRPQEPMRYARLGEWWVDVPSNRLLRGERELRPTPKAMAVLRQLMLAGGAPLTRGELLDRVWQDAYPTDDVLTHAITELRRALEDDPRQPRYIETIPKVGYRLLVPVEWYERLPGEEEPANLPAPLEVVPTPASAVPPQRPLRLYLAASVLLLFAILLPAWFGFNHRAPPLSLPLPVPGAVSPGPRPVTSEPGSEQYPSVSPDGSTVAYGARGSDADPWRIYIRAINGATPLMLDRRSGGGDETYPVWSPDGTHVAFLRLVDGHCRIVIAAALGDYEREVGACTTGPIDYFDWGPDGKALILMRARPTDGSLPGPSALSRLDLESGVLSAIDYERSADQLDLQPRVSPDGRYIAFRRGAIPYSDICVVGISGGVVRPLTHLRAQILGFDWLTDSRHIVFSSDHDGRQQLYVLDAETGAIRPLGIAGATYPSAARRRDVVVFQQDNADLNLTSIPLDGAPGRPVQTIAPSTRTEDWPAIAPDGERIVFVSDRTGESQLWLQPGTTAMPYPLTRHHGLELAQPNWSPDGRRVVYVARGGARSELYVLDVGAGQPRMISQPGEPVRFGSFTADGQGVLCVSKRSGTWQLWRIPLDGGPAVQLGHETARNAYQLGDDGRIYLTHDMGYGLYALDPASGNEEKLSDVIQARNISAWHVVSGGVYYLSVPSDTPGAPTALNFLPFSGGPPVRLNEVPGLGRYPNFSLAPDRTWFVVPLLSRDDTDVMQLDLSPPRASP
mgnify:CR=1 FL=1